MHVLNRFRLALCAAAAAMLALAMPVRADDPPKTPATPAATEPAKPEGAPADAKPAEQGADKKTKTGPALTGRPTRVAVLNFGPPSDWQGKAESMVGTQINAKSWALALEELKKEDAVKPIDVVVVRINSGGGYTLEVERFHRVFEQYMSKFRTVMWIESAISAAIMSPWVIPEIYVLPQGNFGAATAWYGNGVAVEGFALQQIHLASEQASRRAGRDPKIMRAMQVEDALSYTDDENGVRTWFQDETGKVVVKPYGRILTLTADEAVKYGIARAKAGTLDELMKAMGYNEWELAGQKATKIVDDSMIEMTKAEAEAQTVYNKYIICVNGATQLPPDRRGAEVGRARGFLKQLIDWKKKCQFIGPPEEWLAQQDRVLRDLLRR